MKTKIITKKHVKKVKKPKKMLNTQLLENIKQKICKKNDSIKSEVKLNDDQEAKLNEEQTVRPKVEQEVKLKLGRLSRDQNSVFTFPSRVSNLSATPSARLDSNDMNLFNTFIRAPVDQKTVYNLRKEKWKQQKLHSFERKNVLKERQIAEQESEDLSSDDENTAVNIKTNSELGNLQRKSFVNINTAAKYLFKLPNNCDLAQTGIMKRPSRFKLNFLAKQKKASMHTNL
jgi:hypothetical protein